jgi:hypothetical protein
MAALSYEDFMSRVNIQDLLVDAGYQLNRRDGLRYPSYVRYGSDGKRVHGDKFIVTANGLCCFQPPERKNYNVVSFIKEHPHLFADYSPGMSKDKLVNLVCNRILNNPVEERLQNNQAEHTAKPFDIKEYDCKRFDPKDWESQKPFYPYFKNRGIDLHTQRAFAGHFMIVGKSHADGKSYSNLSFPLSLAAKPEQIVGLEERSRPNAEGKTAYKGMAAGSNAAEGLWIGRLENHRSDQGFAKPLSQVKDVYWFESALDAMAFYQLNHEQPGMGDAVYVSTGGSPSNRQFSSMIDATPDATHHLCFDRDRAGEMFALNFALQKEGRVFSSYLSMDKSKLIVNSMSKDFKRYELPLEPFDFHELCDKLHIDKTNIDYRPCDERYKDWNDQLMEKPIVQDENQGIKR